MTTADLLEARDAFAGRWLERAAGAGVPAMRPLRCLPDAGARAGSAVHGLGVGSKVVLGAGAGVRAVRVYVVQKLPRRVLAARDRIPLAIDGVPIDVIESPAAHLAPPVCFAKGGRDPWQQRCDPLTSGISVGRADVGFGTIGAFCRSTAPEDAGRTLLLSNHHVLSGPTGRQGDAVYQPGPDDADGSLRRIGRLLRAWRIDPGSQPNVIDAAVADVSGMPALPALPQEHGRIVDSARAREQLFASKFGRTTGLTRGLITDVNCTCVVGLHRGGGASATFQEQIRIDAANPDGKPVFADDGDSGSLVLFDQTGTAVGLYFAGPPDGRFGLANHLDRIFERLQLTLVTH